MTRNRIQLACCILGLASTVLADEVLVEADFNTQRFIGEVSELDRSKYFNVHSAYDAQSLSAEDIEALNALNVGMGRDFSSPFFYYFGDEPYPTREQAKALAQYKRDQDKKHPNYRYRSRSIVITEHPKFIFAPDEDPRPAAEWAADFFELFYDDDYRPLYYEPMNEPFVHAGEFGEDQDEIRLKMARWFGEIGKVFDERGIDTKIVGYSSAWPSMELWDFGHWESRMKMFLDEAGDHIDAISVHLYDGINVTGQDNRRSGSNAQAILDLVETYGALKWGQPKPFALTEFGGIPSKDWPKGYNPEKHSQELKALNHLMFGYLERQNRIDIAIPFLTTKSPWYWADNEYQPYGPDLWRPDLDSIKDGHVDNFHATEKMTFYQLWSDVSGFRAKASADDPDIFAQAYVDGDTAYLCFNNLEDETRSLVLNVANNLADLRNVSIKRLSVPEGQAVSYTVTTQLSAPQSLEIASQETIIIAYRFSKDIEFTRVRKEVEHYADTYLQAIEADKELIFAFHDCPAKPSSGELRMSLGRKHDRSKQPLVTVNGNSINVPDDWPGYDQANRKDFFGAITIPVPGEFLKKKNKVSIAFPDSGGHVSSLILKVNTESPVN